MVSSQSIREVFLPAEEDCLAYLREQRWPEGVRCPRCGSAGTIKKGRSRKDAQRYRCQDCERTFTDLTGTIFANHQLSVPEMFHVIREMETKSTAQIARQLDRSYQPILEFVHEVQDAVGDADFSLSAVCEADEIYVVAGEKGRAQDDPRERGLSKRGEAPSRQTDHQS